MIEVYKIRHGAENVGEGEQLLPLTLKPGVLQLIGQLKEIHDQQNSEMAHDASVTCRTGCHLMA